MGFLTFFPVELMVGLCGACCTILVCCVISLRGTSGLACLMLLFFFKGPLLPSIFATSTKDLGRHSRRAASIMISAVASGAMIPSIQGAIADTYGTQVSYAICIPAFAYTAIFGLYLWYRGGARLRLRDEEVVVPSVLEPDKKSLGSCPASPAEKDIVLEDVLPVLLRENV
ncbi:hypothetical protein FRC08_017379 [Ceratobasidium sp. 394]|nr:hypothetical protein FRC08_017379 [Ceratobasidium sp. 394]